ncbi:hypothetical protein NDU88_000147 [Pleurodeles waltl]|uniref:Uncharacterized protein n=1 Tax=Pleurodeles waltl TaxID=8319 RepID=A0AAV7VSM3_PLEWA|nr:hypothetical protein NDU88_000147 [Pleurodeles waltl]
MEAAAAGFPWPRIHHRLATRVGLLVIRLPRVLPCPRTLREHCSAFVWRAVHAERCCPTEWRPVAVAWSSYGILSLLPCGVGSFGSGMFPVGVPSPGTCWRRWRRLPAVGVVPERDAHHSSSRCAGGELETCEWDCWLPEIGVTGFAAFTGMSFLGAVCSMRRLLKWLQLGSGVLEGKR